MIDLETTQRGHGNFICAETDFKLDSFCQLGNSNCTIIIVQLCVCTIALALHIASLSNLFMFDLIAKEEKKWSQKIHSFNIIKNLGLSMRTLFKRQIKDQGSEMKRGPEGGSFH